jgi:hypothetical protein
LSQTKILFFNGPPRCGKDTSAIYTMNRFSMASGPGVAFDRFAMPIKRAFAGMVAADIDRFGNVEPWESTKGDIIPWLGVSYRQWQIDFSEGFLKKYGQDIFAKLFVQRNETTRAKAIVVPDSGFAEEVFPVAQKFGEDNILLVRIHRPGFDFTGDSRSYLHNVVKNEVDITNDTGVEEFHKKLHGIVGDFLA